MPNVSVGNPTVAVDLNGGESVSVPTGESHEVEVAPKAASSTSAILNPSGVNHRLAQANAGISIVSTTLHAGDTIKANGGTVVIRGWVVST